MSSNSSPPALTVHTWHYVKKGMLGDDTKGPFDEPSFLVIVERGDLKPDTLVSGTRTSGQWVELKQVPGLLKAVERGQLHRQKTAEAKAAEKQKASAEQAAAEQVRRANEQLQYDIAENQRQLRRQQHLEENGKIAPVVIASPPAESLEPMQVVLATASTSHFSTFRHLFSQGVLLCLAAASSLIALALFVDRVSTGFHSDNAVGYTANQVGWAAPALWLICALLVCLISSVERLRRRF